MFEEYEKFVRTVMYKTGIIMIPQMILMLNKKYGLSSNEINKVISTLSAGRFELKEATLYTAFKRLEELGYIASYWGDSGAGARRRYYTITPAGREACDRLLAEWQETKDIMDKLLEVEERQ